MSDDTEDPARRAILARIRALMSKTEANGCTEQEAQSAAAAVDRLMAAYEIDLSETNVASQEVIRLDMKLDHHPVRWAVVRIGRFTDCEAWSHSDAGEISYLGLEIDTEVAEYLTLLFHRAIDRETLAYTAFNPELALVDGTGRREMVHSFQVGMASRLGDRLLGLKNKRDFTRKSTGFDLVAAKAPLIAEAMAVLGLNLGKSRGVSVKHSGAYAAGRSAAEGVPINQGVAGRSGGAGRIK